MSQKSIRELLRKHPGGLSVSSIAAKLGKDRKNIRRQIAAMPDKYVIGWTCPARSPVRDVPVYAVVVVPDDCPMP